MKRRTTIGIFLLLSSCPALARAQDSSSIVSPMLVAAPPSTSWANVHTVATGTEVRIDTDTVTGQIGWLVAVDESGLTIVNVANLPSSVRRVARDLARRRPDVLLNAGVDYTQDHVRLTGDSLWVDSTRVADRATVIERVSRANIQQIRYPDAKTGTLSNGTRGALIGLAAGAVVGYWSGSHCINGAVSCADTYGFATMPIGGGAGAVIGYVIGRFAPKPPGGAIYIRE